MTRRTGLRAGALILLCLAAAATAGCGSDSQDAAVAGATATAATPSAAPPPATTGGAITFTTGIEEGALCSDEEEPNGLDHTVSGIPADDPDGGLVVGADAGAGADRLDVLPSGTPVITTNDPATCLVVADGGVWWKIGYGEDQRGWVNSRYLSRTAAQEAAGLAEICRLYSEVVLFESAPGEFAPEALTAELEAALNAPPVGVRDALESIANPADEADLAEAYASLEAYVGPLCP